ncbi:MAG: GxxExxY protein [Verrucomicrobiota bacterium JB022]|nr:GxxExxY protein [Verrucomicrobiota bacterium JB022]
MDLAFENITREIIGASFQVHRELGYGFLEKVYQRAMQVELLHRGLKAEAEVALKVHYRGVVVGDYFADLLIENTVMVELKVAAGYCSRDEAQLINELKATDVPVGLLINFGREKVEFKRLMSPNLLKRI